MLPSHTDVSRWFAIWASESSLSAIGCVDSLQAGQRLIALMSPGPLVLQLPMILAGLAPTTLSERVPVMCACVRPSVRICVRACVRTRACIHTVHRKRANTAAAPGR